MRRIQIRLFVLAQVRLATLGERGQTTAEYVLLILGAATIAILVTSWASGTDKVGRLFDRVLNSLITKVGCPAVGTGRAGGRTWARPPSSWPWCSPCSSSWQWHSCRWAWLRVPRCWSTTRPGRGRGSQRSVERCGRWRMR